MNFETIYGNFDSHSIEQFDGTIEQRIYAALRQHFMQAVMKSPSSASRALHVEDPYLEGRIKEFFAQELRNFRAN